MRKALALALTLSIGSAFAAPVWKPLFDGKSWAGWKILGAQTYWKIDPADSSITGLSLSRTEYSMVFTDKKDFDQFTIKYQYRLKVGCSGFFFRSKEQSGGQLVRGMQVEAKFLSSGYSEMGSLYCHQCDDESGLEKFNGWVDPHNETYSDAIVKPGPDTYQQVYLTVKRPFIYVNVNGHQSVGETDQAKINQGAKPARNYVDIAVVNSSGQFGLQIHGSQEKMDVRFRDIAILTGCNDSTSSKYDGKFVAGTSNKHPAYYQDNGGCTASSLDARQPGLQEYFGMVSTKASGMDLEITYPGAHSLDIINLDGKIVFSGSAPSTHSYHVRRKLESGVYFAMLRADTKSASRKIIVP